MKKLLFYSILLIAFGANANFFVRFEVDDEASNEAQALLDSGHHNINVYIEPLVRISTPIQTLLPKSRRLYINQNIELSNSIYKEKKAHISLLVTRTMVLPIADNDIFVFGFGNGYFKYLRKDKKV